VISPKQKWGSPPTSVKELSYSKDITANLASQRAWIL
jgi:hypothetical protein